jgi:hypothetical protein
VKERGIQHTGSEIRGRTKRSSATRKRLLSQRRQTATGAAHATPDIAYDVLPR